MMATLTAMEFGANTCAVARASVRRGGVLVSAMEVLDPTAFPGTDAFSKGLRQARKALKLPRRVRAVVWGLPDGANRKDPAVAPMVAPLVNAGFRIERVVTPCNALAALARLRTPRFNAATCWLAINRDGVAIVAVRPGKLLYSNSFLWDSSVGATGSQARLLQRYSLVSVLAPEVKRALAAARSEGTPVEGIVTCGNLPDLRSLTMPLIEELDVEVETLDSLEGLSVKPGIAGQLGDAAAAIRIACAAALARGTRPWRAKRPMPLRKAAIAAAAIVAVSAFGWFAFGGRGMGNGERGTGNVGRGTAPRKSATGPATRNPQPMVRSPEPVRTTPKPAIASPPTVTQKAEVAPRRTAPVASTPQPVPAMKRQPVIANAVTPKSATANPIIAKPIIAKPITKSPITANPPTRNAERPVSRSLSPVPPLPESEQAPVAAEIPKVAPPTSLNPAPPHADKPEAGPARTAPLPPLLKDPLPRVTAILVADERRFATIDEGHIITVGDVIGRRTVVAIDERAVVLREPSGVQIRVGLGGKLEGIVRTPR